MHHIAFSYFDDNIMITDFVDFDRNICPLAQKFQYYLQSRFLSNVLDAQFFFSFCDSNKVFNLFILTCLKESADWIMGIGRIPNALPKTQTFWLLLKTFYRLL